jgi:hypothetical protein
MLFHAVGQKADLRFKVIGDLCAGKQVFFKLPKTQLCFRLDFFSHVHNGFAVLWPFETIWIQYGHVRVAFPGISNSPLQCFPRGS